MNGQSIRWFVAAAVIVVGLAAAASRFFPSLPNPLVLELAIPEGEPGRGEPLVVSGRTGEGDFLFVRYLDARTIVLGYDSWGSGGPLSKSIKLVGNERHRVEIEMPGLDQIYSRVRYHPGNRVRVVHNGETILDEKVQHYVRDATAIWIGENPIGGSSCGPRFRGEIWHDGHPWRGGIAALFTSRERFAGWLQECHWQLLALLALGAAIVRWFPAEPRLAAFAGGAGAMWRKTDGHRAVMVAVVVCAVAFCWVVTGGSFRVIYPEGFGSFYDFQAASLLQGRLDVPEEGISGEAFIYDGKSYGYFGITPALMRLPFVIFDVAFGKLSRIFMLVDYLGCLLAGYLILRTAARLVAGESFRLRRTTAVLFTLNVGLGSTIFFLSSRAYIYHEAILCGVMFALFSGWCALRYLARPTSAWWIGALLCGILSVHARPPTGLFALSFLGACAVMHAWRRPRAELRRAAMISLGCVLGVLSFNGLSYLKFRNFEGAPLRLNVQYNPARLARIEGKNFHISNLRFNFFTYVLRPNLDFQPGFPWVYLGYSKPKPFFPEAKSDYADRTLAMPYAMPSLFVLAIAGTGLAWLVSRASRGPLVAGWIAIVPMALAMFTAIATVHRYTADFCPWLVLMAAFGFVAVDFSTVRWAGLCRGVIVVVTGWTLFLTSALTLHYQGKMVWGVTDDVTRNYQQLRDQIDGFVSRLNRR